uniref:Uncharacterized protein n=1 Tax=Anguilla anguilla TaxID=7936 RepID=A0A0E9PZJ2_ANGAN
MRCVTYLNPLVLKLCCFSLVNLTR